MKRLGSSDSLGAMISICPSAEEKGGNHVYTRGFQSILEGYDEEDCVEEAGHIAEKKRRLSVDQVKALEKNFEVENKLEPERKGKLAQELGLQPRQVAVWFQNRRARWKTKQLERDYGVLKANYEALKINCDALRRENEALLAEIKELKSKPKEETTEPYRPIKEEIEIAPTEPVTTQISEQSNISAAVVIGGSETSDPDKDCYNRIAVFLDFKDGSSDSDSSGILNDENSPNSAISSGIVPQQEQQQQQLMMASLPPKICCSSSPSTLNYTQLSDSRVSTSAQKSYYQFMRMEEHNFLNTEDTPCNFFSDEQAPTLPWYCSEQWT
eukprot:TRINITY_DN1832_c0_g1_i1.p1 TRINITY_DN1832_c0_g1~~TRINITY_DN1832_c0_g1_i1.p1  ORF type:complete len:326 (-),score=63.10 TRINITY_DN1832_c0_g1_i1:281-1258(-)